MKLLLLIPALVSGFIFCHRFQREYFKLHRYQGQYLYLRSTSIGLIFLLIETIAYLLLHKYVPSNINLYCFSIPMSLSQFFESLLSDVFSEVKEAKEAVFVFQAAVFTPILASLTASYLNHRLRKGFGDDLFLLHRYESQTGPMDRLIADAFVDRSSLLFTLSSGKVYVGDILGVPLPNESEKQNEEFTILPIMSGYRSNKKHKVKFTSDYDPSKLPDNLQSLELAVVFNKKDLVSVSDFDFELYKHLNKKKSKDKKSMTDKSLQTYSSFAYGIRFPLL